MINTATIALARMAFPRGLEQPEGSLRFGMDALLLSAFVARHVETESHRRHPPLVVELGCGCGAALLGLALRCPSVCGLGLDREKALVSAAERNAMRLGLADRVSFMVANFADVRFLHTLTHSVYNTSLEGKLDMVLANPPFDIKGRASPHELRERGLRAAHQEGDPLEVFCRAATMLLRHLGFFFCIWHALSLPRLCLAMDKAGLGLRHVLPVVPQQDLPAKRVLVVARKNAAHNSVLEAPLPLHDKNHGWTDAALDFCPYLA
ncbi:MAG: methyltransferase domain-containing protein [Desulfovibrio sp.]|nr:methyltransferase domain-containing protein [Desulfovibrio sp.]